MEKRTLGKTGLEVTRLGAGLAAIGEELTKSDVAQAGRVLNVALDGGINLLDTAAGYFISEELVGMTVAHRRDEYVLATKAGRMQGGRSAAWSYAGISESIDRSLVRMKTDHLDIIQLHSCDVDVLERGDVIRAQQDAKKAGKTRFIGYSGDNEAAQWAVDSGLFDTLQTSFSIADQHARTKLFSQAKAKDMGIIIKRTIANGAWGSERSPTADLNYGPMRTYGDEYFRRVQIMIQEGPVQGVPENRILTSIGFVLAHEEVSTALVGTQNPDHMTSNIDIANDQFPIPQEVVEEFQRRFDKYEDDWRQLI